MNLIRVLFWTASTPVFFALLVIGAYYYQSETMYTTLIPQATANEEAEDEALVDDFNIYSQVKGISTDAKLEDARPIILAGFLEKHNSPLKPYDYYGQFLTDLADTYELDVWLLPSISMQESNLCKKIPEGTFNCLGLGIHSQGTWGFDSYEENFEAAAKILKKNYIDKGYVTPDEIQDKYTPGSNGSWEYAVNYFMDVLEHANY